MTDFSNIANKPDGFDLTTLEALIDNAATHGGQFMKVTFKCSVDEMREYVTQAFEGAEVSNQGVGVRITRKRDNLSCNVFLNGYVSSWCRE